VRRLRHRTLHVEMKHRIGATRLFLRQSPSPCIAGARSSVADHSLTHEIDIGVIIVSRPMVLEILEEGSSRAQGNCECCGDPAPFRDGSGRPFLEVHHIPRMIDGGPDRLDSLAAVCPNCHRESHHGQKRDQLNEKLLHAIREKERRVVSA
jgi:hypothetical protein